MNANNMTTGIAIMIDPAIMSVKGTDTALETV
jgi:hypothetical protein